MDRPQTIMTTLLAGSLSAGLVVFPAFSPLPGLLFLSYFSCLPLFLIGLRIGLPSLYGACLLANILVFLGGVPVEAGQFFIQTLLGPLFLVNRALLHRKNSSGETTWYPSSELLKMFTLSLTVGVFIALGAYAYTLQGKVPTEYIDKFVNLIDPQHQGLEIRALLTKIFPLLPGFFVLSWGTMVLINASLAQGLLVRFNKNLRPSPSLQNLHAPLSFSIAFLSLIALSFVGGGYTELFAKNAACIFALPLFLVGLGMVHRWIYKTTHTTLALTFLYLLLLFFWPILIVIGLGTLKPWIEKFIET